MIEAGEPHSSIAPSAQNNSYEGTFYFKYFFRIRKNRMQLSSILLTIASLGLVLTSEITSAPAPQKKPTVNIKNSKPPASSKAIKGAGGSTGSNLPPPGGDLWKPAANP